MGGQVITGALEELYQHQSKRLHDQLILRPFPQGPDGQKQWEYYRQEMIAHAGVAVFVFGNKLEAGQVVPANGVRREFEIARDRGLLLIPIGATGASGWNSEGGREGGVGRAKGQRNHHDRRADVGYDGDDAVDGDADGDGADGGGG